MFSGYLSHEEMEDEHPLELQRIQTSKPVEPDTRFVTRKRIFSLVYGVFALALLVGVYIFVTFEETAVETVIPSSLQQVALFAQLPPTPQPTSQPATTARSSWENGISELFQTKCSFCHGGTIPLADLDLTEYDSTILSDTDVPAIVPSDALASNIIIRQQTGDHPVQFTALEFAEVYDWIERGAPRTDQEE
jgi:hypothetical protein